MTHPLLYHLLHNYPFISIIITFSHIKLVIINNYAYFCNKVTA